MGDEFSDWEGVEYTFTAGETVKYDEEVYSTDDDGVKTLESSTLVLYR